MLKVMNAVRADTGDVSKQEKRRLCHLRLSLCYTASIAHSHHFNSTQHNEPETSKQRTERKRARKMEGGRQKRKKRLK